MPPAPPPAAEAARLKALVALQVLDSAAEDEFDGLARAASVVCGTPISLLTFIDAERLWFKAKVGLAGVMETPREIGFCTETILGDDILEIPDAVLDARFADNPLVVGEPKLRFYAGAPIRLGNGHTVGTVCVIDQEPRLLDAAQREVLRCLAITAAKMLECRQLLLAQNKVSASLQATLRELQARKDQMRRLYEATPAMLHSIDAEGRLLMVSDAWLSRLKYQRDEVVGRMSTDFLVPASRHYARQVVLPAFFATGRCDNVEYQMVARDGTVLDVLLSAVLERDADGIPLRSLTAIEDVTARRAAERALRDSEARYRVIADATSDVITQLDLALNRHYVSPACRAMLGYEPEEMRSLPIAAQIHPDDISAARTTMVQLAAGAVPGDRATTTSRLQHKDGHWVWLEAGMSLVRDPETLAPLSIVCALRDISERRRVAQDLEHARAAAERAAQSKAEFLANMSHELRTPLTGILGIHDLLQGDPTVATHHRHHLRLAHDAGQSLMAIINDVLDFSKIEAGQLNIETVPFDPVVLVEACRAFVAQEAAKKCLALEVRFSGAPSMVLGDPVRLRQVLLNLVSNAVKFTATGRVLVDASYLPGVGCLRLSVSDTGIGIPESELSTIFERFQQADGSITRQFGGTGLGLAICKKLVALMGGEIRVVSGLGVGSTFAVELPAPRAEIAPPPIRPQDMPAAGSRDLLLVEDNRLNQMIIGDMLRKRGHRVTIVEDGAAAVTAATGDSRFDVILMDIQMPVLDGYSATRAIRDWESSAGCPRTPIIGLTAGATDEDKGRCRMAGMDAHVTKPVDWTALFTRIEQLAADGPASTDVSMTPAGPPVLDDAGLDALGLIIGGERLAAMLQSFAQDLQRHTETLAELGDTELADCAHGWVSIAGHLGFAELQHCATVLETELRQDRGRAALPALKAAVGRALAAARIRALATAA